MLMPTAGSNFNASDVLQFKLIKAAKERNNNQGNTISRNIESIKKYLVPMQAVIQHIYKKELLHLSISSEFFVIIFS